MRQPCPGLTMLRTPHGAPFLRVHYSADETMTPQKLADIKAKYTAEAFFRREMEIEADALSGSKVFPEYDPAIHVISHNDIPKKLCRYMAIDPHPRTPHAFMWIGVDAWNDWYVYREIWPSKIYGKHGRLRDDDQEHEFTTKEYADVLAQFEGNQLRWTDEHTDREYAEYVELRGGEKILSRYMDQAGKGFKVSAEGQELETYATRYAKYGISCLDPKKSHQAGEDAIRSLLKPRFHEYKPGGLWPRLHISDQCPETDLELRNLRYKVTRTPSEERDLKEERSQFRCHMTDLLRYLATAPLSFLQQHAS